MDSFTRRSFLRAIGLATAHAGISTSQIAIAQEPFRRRGTAQRILVLGAGLSGLAAANELVRAGHDVTVLEGQPRAGGRVFTLRSALSEGHHVELGAGRIPANHDWTISYAKRFGLELVPFAPTGLAETFQVHGKNIRVRPKTDLLPHFSFSPEELRLGISGMIQKYIVGPLQEVLAAGDPAALDWPPPALREFDRYDFPAFLRSRGASRGFVDFVCLGAIPKEASALFIFRVLSGTDRENLFKIKGGNDLLPLAMARELGPRIVHGARVVRIEQSPTGVTAICRRGDISQKWQADRLICTLPFSVLKSIEVAPQFTPLKQRAIRELEYASVVKVALQTPQRHWESRGLSGFAQLDSGAEIWHPTWDTPGRTGILQLYQEGARADRLDDMTEQARVRSATALVEGVFPGFTADLEHSASWSWTQNQWARGAYCVPKPGQCFDWYPDLPRPEGRIHFAGEHTSSVPGFMQGALASGYRAAQEAHEAGAS